MAGKHRRGRRKPKSLGVIWEYSDALWERLGPILEELWPNSALSFPPAILSLTHDKPIAGSQPSSAPRLRRRAVTGMLTPRQAGCCGLRPSPRSETPVTAYVNPQVPLSNARERNARLNRPDPSNREPGFWLFRYGLPSFGGRPKRTRTR